MKRINLETQVGTGENSYVNYKYFFIKIKSCSYKLIFFNQFYPLVIKRILAMKYNLHLNSWLVKLTSTLLTIKKNIPKAISILILANKKNLFKELRLSILIIYPKESNYYNKDFKPITINLLSTKISLLNIKPSFFVKLGYIILILIPKLMRVLIKS